MGKYIGFDIDDKKTDRIHARKQGPSVVRWLVTEASWRAIKWPRHGKAEEFWPSGVL